MLVLIWIWKRVRAPTRNERGNAESLIPLTSCRSDNPPGLILGWPAVPSLPLDARSLRHHL